MIHALSRQLISAAEQGLIPDLLIRWGIRKLCRQRLKTIHLRSSSENQKAKADFVSAMRRSAVAPVPEAANEQHYELPAEFFAAVLGTCRKYSGCYWPDGVQTLEEAEIAALETTCARAELGGGQKILELGCGWGSLTLYMAEHYPSAQIAAASNSSGQRAFIEREARRRGLSNISVITADMNTFEAPGRYDRIVSIEMFEHMRNYQVLLRRVAEWLLPTGKLFVHVFCHKSTPYRFESNGPADWMAEHFFTGGIMPSEDLFLHFQDHLRVEGKWHWPGIHYQKTAEAWLQNLDRNAGEILPILAQTYGEEGVHRWFNRWRMFFMACAETFGYNQGQEWGVVHYLLKKASRLEKSEDALQTSMPEPAHAPA